MRRSLQAIAMLGSSLACSAALALPVVTGTQAYTENIGPNPVIDSGWMLAVGATAITPAGAGTSAVAVHVPSDPAQDLALAYTPSPVFPGAYFGFVPYAGQSGSWSILATDATGTGSATTHDLSDVRELPLVQDLSLAGDPLAPTIGWTRLDPALYPSGCQSPCSIGFDFFNYAVIVRSMTGALQYQTAAIPNLTSTPTSWTLPAGTLQPGQTYLLGVRLNHNELEAINPNGTFVSPLENRSTAYIVYSTPIPEPGAALLMCAGLLVLGRRARRR